MSESQGRASEASRIATATANTRMKWDKLGMDFITGLPRTRSGYDSIWVVVDHLTEVAHCIPVKTTYMSAKLAKIYMTGSYVCMEFRGPSIR